MKVRDGIRRSAVAVGPDATLEQAAQIMDHAGVGALAVVDGDALVGIVTDRDLVRRGLARGLAGDARVDAVMSSPVITIGAEADLHEVYRKVRERAVRRIAVLDDGRFVGMVSVDDLLVDLAADLADLARPVSNELRAPQRDGGVPATRGPVDVVTTPGSAEA
jgi:CBS domain-containing protein